jgi:hypothetical protein
MPLGIQVLLPRGKFGRQMGDWLKNISVRFKPEASQSSGRHRFKSWTLVAVKKIDPYLQESISLYSVLILRINLFVMGN